MNNHTKDAALVTRLRMSYNMDTDDNPYKIIDEIRAEARAEALREAADRAVTFIELRQEIAALMGDDDAGWSISDLRAAITQEEV